MHSLVMEVNDIELGEMPAHQGVMCREMRQRIGDIRAAQRFRPGRDQPGRRDGVAAGEQRDIMPGGDQRFGQI